MSRLVTIPTEIIKIVLFLSLLLRALNVSEWSKWSTNSFFQMRHQCSNLPQTPNPGVNVLLFEEIFKMESQQSSTFKGRPSLSLKCQENDCLK